VQVQPVEWDDGSQDWVQNDDADDDVSEAESLREWKAARRAP
jgi:hypothetical protein